MQGSRCSPDPGSIPRSGSSSCWPSAAQREWGLTQILRSAGAPRLRGTSRCCTQLHTAALSPLHITATVLLKASSKPRLHSPGMARGSPHGTHPVPPCSRQTGSLPLHKPSTVTASIVPFLLLLRACCQASQQVPGPESLGLHTEIHLDPFWGSQAMGDKPRAVQEGPHHPKGSPKQEGKRWEMGVLGALGAPLCWGSLQLSPRMHPAPPWEGPHSIRGGLRGAAGDLGGIDGETGNVPSGSPLPPAWMARAAPGARGWRSCPRAGRELARCVHGFFCSKGTLGAMQRGGSSLSSASGTSEWKSVQTMGAIWGGKDSD